MHCTACHGMHGMHGTDVVLRQGIPGLFEGAGAERGARFFFFLGVAARTAAANWLQPVSSSSRFTSARLGKQPGPPPPPEPACRPPTPSLPGWSQAQPAVRVPL